VGEVPHSLVSELLSLPRDGDDDEQSNFEDAVKWTAGAMYGGASICRKLKSERYVRLKLEPAGGETVRENLF
jgi:hypothetical protein